MAHLTISLRPPLHTFILIVDFQDMEMECLKTHSAVLSEIGLALLKAVSSHRGLT